MIILHSRPSMDRIKIIGSGRNEVIHDLYGFHSWGRKFVKGAPVQNVVKTFNVCPYTHTYAVTQTISRRTPMCISLHIFQHIHICPVARVGPHTADSMVNIWSLLAVQGAAAFGLFVSLSLSFRGTGLRSAPRCCSME